MVTCKDCKFILSKNKIIVRKKQEWDFLCEIYRVGRSVDSDICSRFEEKDKNKIVIPSRKKDHKDDESNVFE